MRHVLQPGDADQRQYRFQRARAGGAGQETLEVRLVERADMQRDAEVVPPGAHAECAAVAKRGIGAAHPALPVVGDIVPASDKLLDGDRHAKVVWQDARQGSRGHRPLPEQADVEDHRVGMRVEVVSARIWLRGGASAKREQQRTVWIFTVDIDGVLGAVLGPRLEEQADCPVAEQIQAGTDRFVAFGVFVGRDPLGVMQR